MPVAIYLIYLLFSFCLCARKLFRLFSFFAYEGQLSSKNRTIFIKFMQICRL